MLSLISWWQKIFWKNWKYFLIFVAIVFFIVQLGNMSSLGIFFDSSSTANTKHRQHVAIKKIFPKWEVPHHSRLIRDPQGNSISLRGTLDKDILRYFPNSNGKFTCFNTKNEIDFVKINDDYCDCPEDGSDEPGTNACNNGNFYCERTIINYPVRISSYKVNDGICDCCNGSDEWMEIPVLDTNHFSEGYHLKHNITRCQNRCKNL